MLDHVLALLERRQLADQVDMRKVMQAVEEHYGNPVEINKQVAGGLAFNASDQ